MNKNHKRDVMRAHKNYAKGIEETVCSRMTTMAGGAKEVGYTITIKPKGCVRVRKSPKVARKGAKRPNTPEED